MHGCPHSRALTKPRKDHHTFRSYGLGHAGQLLVQLEAPATYSFLSFSRLTASVYNHVPAWTKARDRAAWVHTNAAV